MQGPDEKPTDAATVADVAVSAPDNSQSVTPDAPVSAPPELADTASAAAAEAPVTVAADATPEAPATLLEQHDAKVAEEKPPAEAKPDEKPADEKAVEAKPDEPKTEEAKSEDVEEKPPVEDAPALDPVDYFHAETGIKLPETVTMDDALRGEFTGALDLLRSEPVKGAQALVDLYNREMGAYAKHMEAEQWRVFREMGEANVAAVMADPVLGGAGHDTAMAQVAVARDHLASRAKPGSPQYEQEMAEFNQMLKNTGAGNTLAMMRFMHNAARFVSEARLPPPNGLPPKNPGRPKSGGGKLEYDHPTSTP